MKKSVLKYSIIAASALILAVAIFMIIFFNRTITVPDVTGKKINEAIKLIEDVGFKCKTTEEYSDTVLKNAVVSQDKEGGTKIKYRSEVTLVVSKGKEQITLPNLKDLRFADAQDQLIKLGFKVSFVEDFSNTVDTGKVIKQSVWAGNKADKGSIIVLTVSKGPDLVIVPNIKGMTLEKAKQTLTAAGLRLVTEIKFSNSVKEGKIISQDVAANMQALRNSAVNAAISAGVANKKGTTAANANNFGKVTTQGNWIYFSGNDSAIYKMRKDGSELQRIYDGAAVSLNVVGEWLYFADGGSNGGIYKIKIDGTEKTKLSDATSYKVYVDGEWIYYTSNYGSGNIYKMKTDGSSVTQITSENCGAYLVYNGYIYYSNRSDNLVYKCSTNGKGKTLVCAGFEGCNITLVGGKLISGDSNRLLSVNVDGSGYQSFENSNIQYSFLNGYDGWVYYLEHDFRDSSNHKSAFCRMKPDGSQRTKILDYDFLNHANTYINVADGWIYFQNEHAGHDMYRVKVDGTNFQRVG